MNNRDKLVCAMIAHNLNQVAVAKLLLVRQSAVSQWLSGKRAVSDSVINHLELAIANSGGGK